MAIRRIDPPDVPANSPPREAATPDKRTVNTLIRGVEDPELRALRFVARLGDAVVRTPWSQVHGLLPLYEVTCVVMTVAVVRPDRVHWLVRTRTGDREHDVRRRMPVLQFHRGVFVGDGPAQTDAYCLLYVSLGGEAHDGRRIGGHMALVWPFEDDPPQERACIAVSIRTLESLHFHPAHDEWRFGPRPGSPEQAATPELLPVALVVQPDAQTMDLDGSRVSRLPGELRPFMPERDLSAAEPPETRLDHALRPAWLRPLGWLLGCLRRWRGA